MTAPGWLLLYVDPRAAPGPEAAPGAHRISRGVWAVPLHTASPEEILSACLVAGVPVRGSVVSHKAVEVGGPAA